MNRKKIILIAFLSSIIIACVGFLYYHSLEKSIRKEKEVDLTTIAELKIDQLVQWQHERIADARVFSQSSFFSNELQSWLNNPDQKILREYIEERLSIPRQEYHYGSIFITSPDGDLLLWIDPKPKHIDQKLKLKIREASLLEDDINTGFYYCELENVIHYDVVAPIIDKNKEVIATVVFRINPADYLYPLIQSWPTSSKTSETLLIRKEHDHVLFLNELRHKKGTALNLSIPMSQKTLPAVNAADGQIGIVNGIDYRGVKVVAYISPIPGTNWYMVSKVDQKELFNELIMRGAFVFVLTVLLILLFSTAIILFYNLRQKNIYRSLYETQEEFKTTLYSIGDAVITTDRLGHVKQINKIAEGLTGWVENDAGGKPLTEVFQIVSEVTGKKVENPVDKVIRDGMIVGLANHTLLISKDGKETPIADSAAPIKNSNGEIIGVVLVFRDQSDERRHIYEIEAARDFAEGIIATLHEGLLVLNDSFNIISANRTFYQSFNVSTHDVIGKSLFSICDKILNFSDLRQGLNLVLNEDKNLEDFELKCGFDGTNKRVLSMNAQKIDSGGKGENYIFLSIKDVTEKETLIEQLIVAKEKAEESDKLKTAFLANMSHEIRTPLNGILGFSNMIVEEKIPIKEKKRYLKIIENSGVRLLNIVNDILDISLIQSNQIKIKMKEFLLHDFLNELLILYKTLKQEKIGAIEFALVYSIGDIDRIILTDKDRLFQIFKNLLDNAFKFTESGFIKFGIMSAIDEFTFFVHDSGKGIPSDKINLIFEKFNQVDVSTSYETEGTGLGLAISKGLVERMGGKIWVESELGKGTIFKFVLPLKP